MAATLAVVVAFAVGASCYRSSRPEFSADGTYHTLIWGFKQVANSSAAFKEIERLDDFGKVASTSGVAGTTKAKDGSGLDSVARVMCGISFVGWLLCVLVFGFVTGAVMNAFRNRKQKIDAGLVHYRFRDHGIVIGWDFQGVAAVRGLLGRGDVGEVLVVSKRKARAIRDELAHSLSTRELSRVYVYNGSLDVGEVLEAVYPEASRVIVVLGDREGADDDGEVFCLERRLRKHVLEKGGARRRIKLYLHVEDALLCNQARTIKLSWEEVGVFDVEICNFFESWAWRCWSELRSTDGTNVYLPLRHRPGSDRVELFVLGAGPMGQAFANYAMTVMNYGVDRKHCRITIFDENRNAGSFLPDAEVLAALPEVEVVHRACSGGSEEANGIMVEAAKREDTSVTIVIAKGGPGAAVRTYAELSRTLRRCPVSVLVCQSTQAENCPAAHFVQTAGEAASVRFFGMTDVLPWFAADRLEYGKAVNFFYGLKDVLSPLSGGEIVASAPGLWDAAKADALWAEAKRWGKWSSVNSGDGFKEKAAAFADCATAPKACEGILRAEHNRWWTERLLAGWKYGSRDDSRFLHPLLVKFDDLDEATKSIDKIGIAAMAQCGFFKRA